MRRDLTPSAVYESLDRSVTHAITKGGDIRSDPRGGFSVDAQSGHIRCSHRGEVSWMRLSGFNGSCPLCVYDGPRETRLDAAMELASKTWASGPFFIFFYFLIFYFPLSVARIRYLKRPKDDGHCAEVAKLRRRGEKERNGEEVGG